MNVKKILWIIVLIGVFVSGGIGLQRMSIEQSQPVVELVYDYRALQNAANSTNQDLNEMMTDLQLASITSLGVSPLTVKDYLLTGQALPPQVQDYLQDNRDDMDKLLDLPVEFARADINHVQSRGFMPVLRLANAPWDVEIPAEVEQQSLVILGGREVPDNLHTYKMRVGSVEFTAQAGLLELTSPEQIVRVHGIMEREMENLSAERIVTRFIRAARERNIRIFYLRPFPTGDAPWESSLALLTDLKNALPEAGFRIGESAPFPAWQVPTSLTLLVWAGVWAGALLFVMRWVAVPKWMLLAIFGGGLGGTIGLSTLNFGLAQQAIALLAAIIFPCLAVWNTQGKSTFSRFVSISLVSLFGGILVVGTLTGSTYLIKAAEFRGVKLMHVLPIAIVGLAGIFWSNLPIQNWKSLRTNLAKLWHTVIPLKYLVCAGLCCLVGIIYLLRTGNFGLPSLGFELTLREFLERVLIARPRTKEFLIGHPALFFALRTKKDGFSWWMPIAVIGQLSMINTFTHIHTPLGLTLLRTGYGLVFGYLIGWLAFVLFRIGKGLFQSDRGVRVSRVR